MKNNKPDFRLHTGAKPKEATIADKMVIVSKKDVRRTSDKTVWISSSFLELSSSGRMCLIQHAINSICDFNKSEFCYVKKII